MITSKYIHEITQLVLPAIGETLYMCFFSSLIAVIIGMAIGIALYVTSSDSIMPNSIVNVVLGTIVNIGRSVPFVIIIIAVFPLAKFAVGTIIGPKATIVPLTIASIPFVARVIQNSLMELDKGVIEAAMSFGASNFEIIFKVLLPEVASSIVNGITLTIVSIIGYSAMAGYIGGGGLGDVAIRYGYTRFRTDVLYITIIIMVVLVQIVQFIGNKIGNHLDKR